MEGERDLNRSNRRREAKDKRGLVILVDSNSTKWRDQARTRRSNEENTKRYEKDREGKQKRVNKEKKGREERKKKRKKTTMLGE